MNSTSIAKLLESRGAWVKGATPDLETTLSRHELTRRISENYAVFEQVRDRVLHATESFMRHAEIIPETLSPEGHELLGQLLTHGLIIKEQHGHEICEVRGRRYLSGGWLEELAWAAAREAGAHEALYGQCVGWKVKGFSGENEIDLIVRRGSVLGFVSCKALRSVLDTQDRKHRNRLMDAVHEADNLADHFGLPGERVAVLVTTDLHDEMRGVPRYTALMGKAAVLDVRIIPMEELGWTRLVQALTELWEDRGDRKPQ
jgi:hypothetical protein